MRKRKEAKALRDKQRQMERVQQDLLADAAQRMGTVIEFYTVYCFRALLVIAGREILIQKT